MNLNFLCKITRIKIFFIKKQKCDFLYLEFQPFIYAIFMKNQRELKKKKLLDKNIPIWEISVDSVFSHQFVIV